jgi:hypothetical protein
LPLNWTADGVAGAVSGCFRRVLKQDELGRLVRAATGTSADLSNAEFSALRRLLEDRETWSALIGRGTLEDLAVRISSCVPPCDGRTAGDSYMSALAIARGLLEFTYADLGPQSFQRVLLARLQRIDDRQADAFDEVMLGLQAGIADVMDQLKQVLDRLPGPAGRGDLVIYLRTLIDWLGFDPWPRELGGPGLSPVEIERRLRVTGAGRHLAGASDADVLASRCRRLVILGSPGAGKTWLARRAARRAAEEALRALVAGSSPGEVELPLYTTCSQLVTAGGGIRLAAVTSALDQLPDLGGTRINAALRDFFTERDGPTLLVIDSLDEASGAGDRLRQAGPLPWRIVLTSRPSSWKDQLAIDGSDVRQRVVDLEPLRYPDDVAPFMRRWFAGDPERGAELARQISGHPDLQQAATVPLILTFYCIIGTSAPLPASRHDLYTRLLRRVLTGFWRARNGSAPDPDECLGVLREWASTGAEKIDPVSGVGAWDDDVSVGPGRLAEADERAVDHVAVPLGPPSIDTGMLLRRFIHRSVREHLVAEYLACLPVDEAAAALLPHLWFDPDWEYAAPAAIVMHPERDQLLRDLICRAARSDKLPADLSYIDAGWEFRGLLARVAAESREDDWSAEVARVIGDARLRLARSGHIKDLGRAASWETSNRQVRDALLRLLASQPDQFPEGEPVSTIIRTGATADDKRRARETLLGLLAGETNDLLADCWITELVQTDPTADEKRRARETLLGLLAADPGHWNAHWLMRGLVRLASTSEEKRQARETLLGLLARETNDLAAAYMATALAELAATGEERRHAYDLVLGMLIPDRIGYAPTLLDPLVDLATTVEERQEARQAMIRLLADPANFTELEDLVRALVNLGPTADDIHQVGQILLARLTNESSWSGGLLMVRGLHLIDLAADDKRQVRETLLGLLEAQGSSVPADQLVDALVKFDPTADEMRRTREGILRLLAREVDLSEAALLVRGLAKLVATADDRRYVCRAILRLLDGQAQPWAVRDLLDTLVQLATTPYEMRQARQKLLKLLDDQADTSMIDILVSPLVQLAATAEEKRQARETVLDLLHDPADMSLVEALAGLEPTIHDLTTCHAWAIQPTSDLLAACRRNSSLDDWLAHLPALTPLSNPALQTASRRHPLESGKARARTGNDGTRDHTA